MGGPFPLVLFSHGLGAAPDDYGRLLERLAAAGYVVAAPTYPLTNARAAETVPGDLGNQPGDASFVIGEVLRLAETTGDPLDGVVDDDRIAAAGHSLGAMTTVGLLNGCCRDTRIDAAVVLAGSAARFDGDHFVPPAVPVLFVHGDDDRLVPFEGGRRAFALAERPKAFITLADADHVTPFLGLAEPPAAAVVNSALVAFFDSTLKGDGTARPRLTTAATTSGVAVFDDQL